jgi:hypothetical protein
MSIPNTLFNQVVESLLVQKFICQITDPAGFEYLSMPAHYEDVNLYLVRLGRCIRSTADGAAFYCAYSNVDGENRVKDHKQQFRDTINSLEPLCRWLQFVMTCEQKDSTIAPGDLIRQGELLSQIEVSSPLQEKLEHITRSGLFRTTKEAPKDQLNVVLSELEKMGYLVRQSPNGSLYTATGKWSYLYEVLSFIASHEDVGMDDDTPDADVQGGLLL